MPATAFAAPAAQRAAAPGQGAPPPLRGTFAVQVGAFTVEGNARRLATRLEGLPIKVGQFLGSRANIPETPRGRVERISGRGSGASCVPGGVRGIGGAMPRLIESPTVIPAAGNKPKRIEEYVGRVTTRDPHVSVARMVSPEGWEEPGQRPEFQEITIVLRGMLRVESESGTLEVRAGQAVVAEPGEWVRYGSPAAGGAEYVAICLPAFSPATVHRDA